MASVRKNKHRRLDKGDYVKELRRLQVELLQLEEWVRHKGLRVVVVFEGRDTAGKGGVIKRMTALLNPRSCRVAALPAPSERERTQCYFQRYVAHLPSAGEMVLFDRSWYNRAGVERVMGFYGRGIRRVHADVPAIRAHARPLRNRSHQVLAVGQRRRAGAPVPRSYQRSEQALEAQPNGPPGARKMGRLFRGEGPD